MDFFVHPQGLCESKEVGKDTKIWAFTHILPKAKIGAECNICDYVFIENDVVVGDRVTIKSGVQLWDGVEIHDDVFIGPNVTFTNDRFPRSKHYPEKFLRTIICKKASIGANATLLPGITIGSNAMIGAGSVVLKSIPENAIVVGNPAKIIGFVDSSSNSLNSNLTTKDPNYSCVPTNIKGVSLYQLPTIKESRGNLFAGEFEKEIPFVPKRYFLVTNVPKGEIRSNHAHRHCHEFLICINGSCTVIVDDGHNREEFVLTKKNLGLYIKPMVWISYKQTGDSILLVFASDHFDPRDHIKNYQEFLSMPLP